MKITVLTVERSLGHPDGRRARRVESLLEGIHDVEALSLFGSVATSDEPHRALIGRTGSGESPQRDHGLDAESIAAATSTLSTSLPGHHVLAEAELRLALRSLDADLVILTAPALTEFCRQMLDTSTGLAVILDDPADCTGDLRGADALIVPGNETRLLVTDELGASAPPIHVVAPHAWHRSTRPMTPSMIAAVGSAPSRNVMESVVDAFAAEFATHPGRCLNLAYDGAGVSTLAARAAYAGIHGAVSTSTRDAMENDVLPCAEVVVIAEPDVGDAMTTMLNGIARGACILIDSSDSDIAQLVQDAPHVALWNGSAAEQLGGFLDQDRDHTPSPATEAWLDGIRLRSVQALGDAVKETAERSGRNTLENLVERSLRASHGSAPMQPDAGPTSAVRPLEDTLLAVQPDLVRWSGTLNEEDDSLLEPAALARNLVLTATALGAADIEFVVISSPNEPGRIAVDSQQAKEAVAALRSHCVGMLAYSERIDHTGRRRLRNLASETVQDEHDGAIVVYVPIVSRTRTLRYGPAQGCTIEFWPASTDSGEFTTPLLPTRRGNSLTSLTANASTSVAGVELPTTLEISARGLDDVDFPIDVVWTWVDDTDPSWRERRDAASGSDAVAVNGDDPSRFNNRDELRYSMRSVAMYAPWVRNLYLVTDRQRPSWLSDHPRVTVVDHRDIFSDPSALPTFNSHAIESQLHHIKGLSETFLYFNDDVFLGRRVAPQLFFTSTQQTKAFLSPTTIPPGPSSPDDLGFYASRKNNRSLVEEAFDRTMVQGYLHTPHALRVSVLHEMEERFDQQWAHTQQSRFRSPGDIAIASSLHHAYGQLTDRTVNATLRSRYVKAGRAEHQPLMRQILAQRNLDTFCINDTADRDMDPGLQTDAVRAMLEAYFPMAAPWER